MWSVDKNLWLWIGRVESFAVNHPSQGYLRTRWEIRLGVSICGVGLLNPWSLPLETDEWLVEISSPFSRVDASVLLEDLPLF